MKILTVDIGTGTQDIYLYNSNLDMENNFKLVVPSPTMMVRQRIRKATERGEAIVLDGVMMGGGPSAWAVEDHLRKGLRVYSTPEAARTINDDLEAVRQLGVEIVSEDEAISLPSAIHRVTMSDFDFQTIARALATFGVALDKLAAVVVGVFDHGNAPVGVSDRQFRFDYLDERIRKLNRLSAFAYRAEEVPEIMTRLLAVVKSVRGIEAPLVVMDTAPAAVLGATLDKKVSRNGRVLIANVGNFHTLAFRLGTEGIEGLFEHHTGLVDVNKLERLLRGLANGTLRHVEVFEDHGHGALVYDPTPLEFRDREFDVVVTGPRRSMFYFADDDRSQHLRPYFPAPYGDMMITGCFGLLAAAADVLPEISAPIRKSLYNAGSKGVAPWDSD